jgi:hypothetical protein
MVRVETRPAKFIAKNHVEVSKVMGVPPVIIQVMNDRFSIETYGDLGIPHDLRNTHYEY